MQLLTGIERLKRAVGPWLVIAAIGLVLVLDSGCAARASRTAAAGSAARPAADTASSVLEAEAAAFMAAYGEELRRGDRVAVASRYCRAGAYELRPGRKRFTAHAAIVARYESRWRPPASFEWRDLSYEVVGPDAVVVAGLFAWGVAEGTAPEVLSYTALLRREDGVLRLRLEAEAGAPPGP